MNQRALTAVASAFVAGLTANCGSHSTLTSPGGLTGPSSGVVGLRITAPDAIAPGQTVQVTVTASLSDGTTADYTRKVVWSAAPANVLTMTRDTGQATAQSSGDVTIQALLGPASCCHAEITRTVLPPNTYRLTGNVLESGLPVVGGSITVVSGTGGGLVATTDAVGAYRLYGVAGPIQVTFSKPGYDDVVKPFTATQNDVLDFPEAHQTGGIPALAGTYTLTLTADPACPTTTLRNIPPLPDEFRQPRSYAASLTQNGPVLTVTLTDAVMVTGGNQFTGRIAPDAIEFSIGYYYYGLDDGITEQLGPAQQFEFGGLLHAQRSASGMVGRLDGAVEIATPPPNRILALCVAANNQITLTRTAQPSRHR
jgi:hypothetical protein